MKKFFDKLSNFGCMLPFIIGLLFPVVMAFVGLWKLCNGHLGYFMLNIIMIPFIILGGINIIRGIFAVIEEDGQKFDWKKDWKFSLYIIITFVGYFALFLAVALLPKWFNGN